MAALANEDAVAGIAGVVGVAGVSAGAAVARLSGVAVAWAMSSVARAAYPYGAVPMPWYCGARAKGSSTSIGPPSAAALPAVGLLPPRP